ncbi:hypothetical protein [Xanthomonas sp. NCPPB 2632]|jgi:hypothetical protein|uniref:hypothetical protein n=1 Tax=Xanthomonas sp. NCPPB 2632 TaxID=3240912 RepID=UPI00351163E2
MKTEQRFTQSTAPISEPQNLNDTQSVKKLDFQKMTVGEFYDTLSVLIKSGKISADEATDLSLTFPGPIGIGSYEETRAMPARISYDWLKEVIAFTRPVGRIEEADRHQRVLDIMMGLDGKAIGLDLKA